MNNELESVYKRNQLCSNLDTVPEFFQRNEKKESTLKPSNKQCVDRYSSRISSEKMDNNLPLHHSAWYIISNSANVVSISVRKSRRYKQHHMTRKHFRRRWWQKSHLNCRACFYLPHSGQAACKYTSSTFLSLNCTWRTYSVITNRSQHKTGHMLY